MDIGKTIHPHPTLGESIGMAAEVAALSRLHRRLTPGGLSPPSLKQNAAHLTVSITGQPISTRR